MCLIILKTSIMTKKTNQLDGNALIQMLSSRDVQKEFDMIYALLATHVALEGVIETVISHVNGVQNGIPERNATGLALELMYPIGGGRDGLFLLLILIGWGSGWV